MATTSVSLPDLREDGFREILFDSFNRYEGEMQQIFHVLTSRRYNEDDTRIGSLGLVPTRSEGDTLVYDDPPQGFDVTYTHSEYAMGYQVTQIAREDDLYNVINRMPAQLGTSLRQTLETDAQNDLNNAFSGGFTGGDGVSLASSAHPLPGGGTDSNVPSSFTDLDETSYEQALIDIAAWVDDRGKKVNLRPAKLFYHRANQFNVMKLFGSDKEYQSANNAINPAMSGRLGIMPVLLNFLTDTDAWFIQCDTHYMNWFWRRTPEFGRDNDFETDNERYKVTARWSHGHSDWYGMYCNSGAGS